jgi:hypothetical protein
MGRGRGWHVKDVGNMSTEWLRAALRSRELIERSEDFPKGHWTAVLVPYRHAIEAELATLVALVADRVDRRPPCGASRSSRSRATSRLRLIRGGLRRQLEGLGK